MILWKYKKNVWRPWLLKIEHHAREYSSSQIFLFPDWLLKESARPSFGWSIFDKMRLTKINLLRRADAIKLLDLSLEQRIFPQKELKKAYR